MKGRARRDFSRALRFARLQNLFLGWFAS